MTRKSKTNTKSNDPYLAILGKDGSSVVAFVNPASNFTIEALQKALTGKGVNAEIRTPNDEVQDEVEL